VNISARCAGSKLVVLGQILQMLVLNSVLGKLGKYKYCVGCKQRVMRNRTINVNAYFMKSLALGTERKILVHCI
jgi:hypothetical protein